MARMSHPDHKIIGALNMIDSRACGFFGTLKELVVLTGLVGLELPGRGKNPVYSATQVPAYPRRETRPDISLFPRQ